MDIYKVHYSTTEEYVFSVCAIHQNRQYFDHQTKLNSLKRIEIICNMLNNTNGLKLETNICKILRDSSHTWKLDSILLSKTCQ